MDDWKQIAKTFEETAINDTNIVSGMIFLSYINFSTSFSEVPYFL